MSDESLTWAEGNRLITQFGGERHLGERIQRERKQRGWSQAELARRLAGLDPHPMPLHQSAISKIEPPDPEQTAGRRRTSDQHIRRNVTIEEAIAFSRVFGIPLGELLLPEDALVHAVVWRMFLDAAADRNTIRNAQASYEHKVESLRKDARASAEFRKRLVDFRAEVMAKIEAERREMHERDNKMRQAVGEKPKRWPGRQWMEANRPPSVITIDDILGGADK